MSLNHVITLSSLQQKLKQAGYETMEQLEPIVISEITNELQLNHFECEQLTKAIDKERAEREAIYQNEQLNSISTQSNNINSLFGFGIPPQRITEICGEAGTGKTQLCMQLGVSSLPKGDCIYIDTEGSCSLNGRLYDISNTQNIDQFHLFPVLSHAELMSFITQLPDILEDFPNTKLIILDSIAFHFRVNVLSKAVRDGLLNHIGSTLTAIAKERNLAVVVVNHVTQEDENSAWIPSLGPAWGNWCNSRLFLYRRRNFRFAYLYRLIDPTVNRPVQFCIKDHGISDPIEDELEIVDEGQTQQKLDNDIEFTFTQLRQEKDEEDEQERVDEFWNDAYPDGAYISNISSENGKLKGKAAVYSEMHTPDYRSVYEKEDEVMYDIQGTSTVNNPDEDVSLYSRDKSKLKLVFPEDELVYSTQDKSKIFYPDENEIINPTQDKSNIINSNVDKLIYSTQDKSKINNIYPNYEIIYSTQDKSIIYETDSEGYLYSTQDKSILKTLYPDDEIIPSVQDKSNNPDEDETFYSTKAATEKEEESRNQDETPLTFDPENGLNLSSLSSLSSEEEDIAPSLKNTVKRKHISITINNTSLEASSKRRMRRERKEDKAVRFQLTSDVQSASDEKSHAGDASPATLSNRGESGNAVPGIRTIVKSNDDGADWDSEEEEQLDYKYIKEMDEYS